MKTLSRDQRIYILRPENEPAIVIDDGDDLLVETWDAFEGIRDPGVLQEKSLKAPPPAPSMSTARNRGMPCGLSSSASPPKRGRPIW